MNKSVKGSIIRNNYMNPSSSNNVTQLEVYKKAVEIFKLSRHIATYISNDKNILELSSSSKRLDSYSLNLIMDSLSLVPAIATASNSFDTRTKRYNITMLRKTIARLHKYCNYLEKNYAQGKDYISLLKKEIAAFTKERLHWEHSLLK